METLLLWGGRLAGLAGILIVLLAGITRVRGLYHLGNFQAGTLLLVGIALMMAACLAYLSIIAERLDRLRR